MVVVAVLGLLVNIAAFLLLARRRPRQSQRQAAPPSTCSATCSARWRRSIAGAVILLDRLDADRPAALSILVAAIIVRSGWQVVAASGHILLEGAPHELDTRHIGPDLIANVPGVESVHHLHVWSITQERRMVTLHVCIGETQDSDRLVKAIKQRLKDRFGLDHATVEIERGECADAADAKSG